MKSLSDTINEKLNINNKNVYIVRKEDGDKKGVYLVFANNETDADTDVDIASLERMTQETRDIILLDDKTLKFYEKSGDVIKL